MRSHSAAAHLAVLALLVATPLLLLVGALLYRSVTLEQAEVRQRIGQVLEALQADIDRDIDRRVAVLETLAASTLFSNQDWPAFHAQAREGLRGRGFLVLIDVEGRQVLNTSVPYGTEPRATGDLQTYERALQGGQPIVSDLFVGVVSRHPVFNVALPVRRDGPVRWVMDRGRVIRDGFGRALRVVGVVLDISDIKEAEQRQRLLFDELSHRVKNTLAIVQALAQQTLRTRPEPQDFATAFSDRLGTLARSHNLLTEHAWRGAALEDLIRGALSAFLDEGRCIDIGGDDVTIPASAAITLGLVMHELATNASKYGALSVPAGRLAVRWTVRDVAGGRRVDLQWTESGGPPVKPPSGRGFGSRLLVGSAQQLGGSFEPDYAADGFRGRLRFTVAIVD